MGYQLGMPSLKLSNTSKPSKHCGNFGGVTREALEERDGRDLDINPELSHLNVIRGFQTAAELMAYSDAHVKELKDASGRAIRKDAVRMCATICKPPAVYIQKIIREQGEAAAEKFFDDFTKKFETVVGKENIKSTSLHKDELGWHLHIFWEPMTADGRLCAKEVHGLKFFAQMNREMPEYMRSCGWEIDDCNCYDCAEENYETEKERAKKQEEDYQRTHSHGKSSAQYKAEAEAERQRLLDEIKTKEDENSKLTKQIATKELQLMTAEAEVERLQGVCDIKNDKQYEELKEKLEADVSALEDFCELSFVVCEARDKGESDKTILDNFIWSIDKWFENMKNLSPFDLLDRIRRAIDNLNLYEKIRKVKDGVSHYFEARVDAALSRAAERSENTNSDKHVTKEPEGISK